MGIHGVLNNIKRKGLSETYHIYSEKKKLMAAKAINEDAIARLYDLFGSLEKTTPPEQLTNFVTQVRSLLSLIDQDISEEEIEKLKIFIAEKETKNYKSALQDLYLKRFLPETYDKYKNNPIEDKIVFLQSRKGLNESFKYIYRKLEKEFPEFDLQFHQLCRGRVPNTFYYNNAEEFTKDMASSKALMMHTHSNLMGHIKIRNETKVIQLWHGCGAYKLAGFNSIGTKNAVSKEEAEEYPWFSDYSVVTVASPDLIELHEEIMGVPKGSGIVQPLGVSRTDVFFDTNYINNCFKKLYKRIPEAQNKKVILYAPTFRGVDPNRVSPDRLDISKLANELKDDYILICKYHQTVAETPPIPEEYENTFAFDMTRGKGMSINELMPIADICISDYSSLVYEYSLLERPIIFFAFDLEDYAEERGLCFPYDEVTPGPICRTNEEMIDYICNIETRFDKQEILDFKNKFMSSCDGHASDRVIEIIKQEPMGRSK